MDDEAARLLDAIERLESRLNSYWNFYTLVVLATVGWLMSAANPFSANQSVAVTVALGLFFLANLSVIRGATRRILALEDELRLHICRAGVSLATVATEFRGREHTRPHATVLCLAFGGGCGGDLCRMEQACLTPAAPLSLNAVW